MVIALGAALAAALGVASIYLSFPGRTLLLGEVLAGVVFLGGFALYVIHRPAARQLVWPR
jgi:hypothetical protein